MAFVKAVGLKEGSVSALDEFVERLCDMVEKKLKKV